MKFFISILLVSVSLFGVTNKYVTPSEVFDKLVYLEEDVRIISENLDIKKKPQIVNIDTNLLPRHAWQRTYEIFVKINILKDKFDLPSLEPINMEPILELEPIFTYEQVLRLIQEIKILKLHIGITKEPKNLKTHTNKTPTDVYNKLNEISRQIDMINSKEFTPSYVFSEVMRIYSDFEVILNKLDIQDESAPPAKKEDSTPRDSFIVALELLNNIRNIELNAGIKTVDFYAFNRNNVTPSDVFEIIQIIIAELQVIKAYIGLDSVYTRAATKYEGKTPADVTQVLIWLVDKSDKLKSISHRR